MMDLDSKNIKIFTIIGAYVIVAVLFFTNGFAYLSKLKITVFPGGTAEKIFNIVSEIVILPIGAFFVSFIFANLLELLRIWISNWIDDKFNYRVAIGLCCFIIILFSVLAII